MGVVLAWPQQSIIIPAIDKPSSLLLHGQMIGSSISLSLRSTRTPYLRT